MAEDRFSDIGSRREYLKKLGAGSIAVSGIGLSGVVRGYDTVEIVVTRGEGEAIRTEEVPAAWQEQTNSVLRVLEKFKREYFGRSDIVGAGATSWEGQTFDGLYAHQISVGIRPDVFGEVAGALPDEFGGVPVEPKEVEPPELTYCYNLTDFNPIPGGVTLEGDSSSKGGTSGYIVKNQETGDEGIATANHLWQFCEDNYGSNAYQNHDYFGNVGAVDQRTDFAVAYTTSSYSIEQEIEEENSSYTVNGYKTLDGIKKLASDDSKNARKMGKITGLQTGAIEDYAWTPNDRPEPCIDYRNEGIRCNMLQAEGDSGCPIYVLEEGPFGNVDYATIIGNGIAGQFYDGKKTTCNGGPYYGNDDIAIYEKVQGPSFYKVSNETNFTVPTA